MQARLTGLRLQVRDAFAAHGPATTKRVAEASGISILTLRPRACELLALVLLVLVGAEGHEGVYRLATIDEIHAALARARGEASADQILMKV